MSGHALEMKCPSCGEWDEHPTVRTLPAKNYPNRMRVKRCRSRSCSEEFCTTEMLSDDYLTLYLESAKLREETENLKSEVAKLKSMNERLQEAVDRSDKYLSPVATPKRIMHSTRQRRKKAA